MGVAAAVTGSDGRQAHARGLQVPEARRLRRLQRTLVRQQKGSNRRTRTNRSIARVKAVEADRRRDCIEKTTAGLAVSAREGTSKKGPGEARTQPVAA